MPSPIVETAFDGLAWQGRLARGEVAASAWISQTHSIEVRSRDAARMGALQLPNRSVHAANWTDSVGGDGSTDGTSKSAGALGLRMGLSRP